MASMDPNNSPFKEPEFSCQFCDAKFEKEASLYGHMNTHKNIQLPCQVLNCGKVLTSLQQYRKHSDEHNGTTHQHTCNICGLNFDRKSQLQYHIERTHDQITKFKCDTCGKGFYKESDLKNHVNIHRGVKNHSCNICNKTFSHISNLNRHIRIHTNERPYVCKECGKRFVQTSTLNNHMRSHKSKVFGQCPECPKNFKTGGVLLQHLRSSHNYSEDSVNSVARKNVLLSHRKYLDLISPGDSQTGSQSSRKFHCSQCGDQFPHKSQLKSHEREAHQTQEPSSVIKEVPQLVQKYTNVESTDQDQLTGGGDETGVASLNVEQIIRNYTNPVQVDDKEPQIFIIPDPVNNLWSAEETEGGETTTIELVLDDNCEPQRVSIISDQPQHDVDQEQEDADKTEVDSKSQCHICHKSFRGDNLKRHLGTHYSEHKLYKCDDCGEKFAWKSTLNKHKKKFHSSEDAAELFSCSLCDKKFNLQSVLTDHVKRDHIQERNYECEICHKQFFKIYDYKYHKRLHSGEKPYACADCGKSFSHL